MNPRQRKLNKKRKLGQPVTAGDIMDAYGNKRRAHVEEIKTLLKKQRKTGDQIRMVRS